MDKLIVSLLMLQATATNKLSARREAGQGTLEYIAMLLIAGVLIVALVGIFGTVGDTLKAKVQVVIDAVTGI
jgi:uncharacterized membrane protein